MTDRINVLGEEYQIVVDKSGTNPKLESSFGYTEPYSKKIVIDNNITDDSTMSVENLDAFVRHIYRHEVVHAFFYESGVSYKFDKDEEDFLVDWIAKMVPKMLKVFKEMGVLEQ